MGLFDDLKSVAMEQVESRMGGAPAAGEQSAVAGGLMQAIQEHPGGIGGLISSFQQNGLGGCVQEWASGASQTASPEQVQQGLDGTGLIEKTAEKAGVSPQVAQMAIAYILPMVIRHFAPNGEAAPHSEFGGLAQQMLSRFL
jgi:uncharacterized protein YidB (DUF937 family)